MLSWLWNLDQDYISNAEIKYLIDYVGFEDGKIGYQILHNSLYTTSHQVQRREKWLSRETHHIRSVVCISRHGAAALTQCPLHHPLTLLVVTIACFVAPMPIVLTPYHYGRMADPNAMNLTPCP